MRSALYERSFLFLLALGLLTYAWFDIVQHLYYLITEIDFYSHGQIVPFVTIGLIWSRRAILQRLRAKFCLPGILLLVVASALWLAGELFEAKIVGHVAYVLAIQSLFLVFFGFTVFKAVLFPMAFLFLIVPFGSDFLPVMQNVTAQMVLGSMSLLGVEYSAEGVLVTLSSGTYEIAEACAGIKFLFTSVVTGILLAHLIYEAWWRRVLLVLASVALPFLANTIRVLGVFLISEATDQSFAKGIDHVVYGWGFLTVVLFVLIAGAYRYSDKKYTTTVPARSPDFYTGNGALSWTVAILACLSLPMLSTLLAPRPGTVADQIDALMAPSCMSCDIRLLNSQDHSSLLPLKDADRSFSARYRAGADYIEVHAGLYCPVRTGRTIPIGKLSLGEGWTGIPDEDNGIYTVDGRSFEQSTQRGGDDKMYIWKTNYIGGAYLTSDRDIKFAIAKERFSNGLAAGATLIFAVPVQEGMPPPRDILAQFLSEFSPDRFLWQALKPAKSGHALCVE